MVALLGHGQSAYITPIVEVVLSAWPFRGYTEIRFRQVLHGSCHSQIDRKSLEIILKRTSEKSPKCCQSELDTVPS